MKATSIVSSNVKALGTDGDDLIVVFSNGVAYRYAGAGRLAESLRREKSVGSALYAQVTSRREEFVATKLADAVSSKIEIVEAEDA